MLNGRYLLLLVVLIPFANLKRSAVKIKIYHHVQKEEVAADDDADVVQAVVEDRQHSITTNSTTITTTSSLKGYSEKNNAEINKFHQANDLKKEEGPTATDDDKTGTRTNTPSTTTYIKNSGNGWKCCVDPQKVNPSSKPDPKSVQSVIRQYNCPFNPSNFSWYYQDPTSATDLQSPPDQYLNATWFKSIKVWFMGGSTTRQMWEQYKWEFPFAGRPRERTRHEYTYYNMDQFIYKHLAVGGCCNYERTHILDLRRLPTIMMKYLRGMQVDFLIVNVGIWWDTEAIGHIIADDGYTYHVGTTKGQEWVLLKDDPSYHKNISGLRLLQIGNQPNQNITTNYTVTADNFPNVTFAHLMKKALTLLKKAAPSKTQIIWRSESYSDEHCHQWGLKENYRTTTILPVLKELQIPLLNISEATCDYIDARNRYDSTVRSPHLCFPSVAMRHWLLQFQNQFM